MKQKIKIIVSGGGTAGHIYPAVAVVEALEKRLGKENVKVLFVGAEGKMEMTKVPEMGYEIVGLPILGLNRGNLLSNFALPFKVVASVVRANKLLKQFKPDVVVGFGGYASLPLLVASTLKGIKSIIWEGNSYAGMSNKILGSRVDKICVSYSGMERFFDAKKLVVTGNPIRSSFSALEKKSAEAMAYFGLRGGRPVVVVTGGSLGARIINEAVMQQMDRIVTEKTFDLIWQVGGYYFEEMKRRMEPYATRGDNVWFSAYINQMSYAYSVADLVVARSGASTVTELSLTKTAAVFVPSSGVTDDHQTKNAQAIVALDGAVLISDSMAVDSLIEVVSGLVRSPERLKIMANNIGAFAKSGAADLIVDTILE